MIEVNLLPERGKRAARVRKPTLALPRLDRLTRDAWLLAAVLLGLVGTAGASWLALSLGQRREEAQVGLAAALADSARYADQIARTNALMASRDSIVQRVTVIQEIDRGRYVWPHIMDEVSRALPDYTWVLRVQQVTGGDRPRVRLVGEAGSIEAITIFMDQLEASPFLRNVTAIGTSQVLRREENQLVYRYEVEVDYEQPPLELLQTVPLIASVMDGSLMALMAPQED